eukprot:6962338-Prymnesium_polylepis.1
MADHPLAWLHGRPLRCCVFQTVPPQGRRPGTRNGERARSRACLLVHTRAQGVRRVAGGLQALRLWRRFQSALASAHFRVRRRRPRRSPAALHAPAVLSQRQIRRAAGREREEVCTLAWLGAVAVLPPLPIP